MTKTSKFALDEYRVNDRTNLSPGNAAKTAVTGQLSSNSPEDDLGQSDISGKRYFKLKQMEELRKSAIASSKTLQGSQVFTNLMTPTVSRPQTAKRNQNCRLAGQSYQFQSQQFE